MWYSVLVWTSFHACALACVCRVIDAILDNGDAFPTYRDDTISRTKSDALLFHVRRGTTKFAASSMQAKLINLNFTPIFYEEKFFN